MDFIEAILKAYNPNAIYNLRTLLCYQGVQVKKDKRVTIIRSLYNIIQEEDQIKQTKEEILDQVKAIKELFTSSKLNAIASLIPNLLN